ncbi:MAG: ATP synthase subunit I [Tissierellia bacterium]|nr:ATP synthase subunit I [Tissierellia bacterium]
MRDSFSNRYVFMGLAYSLLVTGLILLFSTQGEKLAKSFGLGALISIVLFKEIYLTLDRALSMEEARASRLTAIHYFIRYIFYFIVLLIGAKRPDMSLLAIFFGLMSMKIVIHISNMFAYFTRRRKEEKFGHRNIYPPGESGDLDS